MRRHGIFTHPPWIARIAARETIAGFGNHIYEVNGRFDIVVSGAPAPDVEYQLVQVEY